MKKLLFFLIGFCLAFVPVHMAYAAPATYDLQCIKDHIEANTSYILDNAGIFTNEADANAFMASRPADYWNGSSLLGSYDPPAECWSDGVFRNVSYHSGKTKAGTGEWYNFWQSWIHEDSAGETPLDSDGDGLTDDCDLYPDDPNQASYKMMTAAYDDATGDMIGFIVQTDRGDYDHFGDIMENPHGTPGITHEFVGNTSSWRSNDDLCAGSHTGTGNEDYDQMIEDSMTDPEPELPDEGEGQTNQEDGQDTTGTETDNEALQKIIKNTYSTNENIGNLADYLSAINTKLSVQRNENLTSSENLQQVLNQLKNETSKQLTQDQVQAAMSEALESIETLDDVQQSDVDTATVNAGDVDTEYVEAQTQITGDATLADDAPLDYQEKTNIPTKMADYITGNPISDIIENSGLTISGASPTATWNYNGQSMVLTIAGYDAALEAFGQILLGIFTLAGMLLIFRG